MTHPTINLARSRRSAVVYVMAMMYLVLFAMLAVGFVAGSTLSVQGARDDRAAAEARAAAESGLVVLRAQFERWTFTPGLSGPELATAIETAWTDPNELLAPFRGHVLQRQGHGLTSGADDWISLDANNGARCRIELNADGAAVWAKIIGAGANLNVVRIERLRFDMSSDGDIARYLPVAATYDEGAP